VASWWERHVVPRIVDLALGTQQVHEQRSRVCEGLEGRVLELGFGSGLNIGHYPAAVVEVAAVEPNDDAWTIAQRRIRGGATPVVRSGLDGQRLAEPDESFDRVLSTFTLCTIPDHVAALRESFRVLRPGGVVHFLEHGLAPDERVRTWQHRLEPVQRRVAGGCHLTRDPTRALATAGFELLELETGYEPGPAFSKPLGFLYRGLARRPA
jgi:ubiquinone/menaquinone biosynthesis C-methylase UbiE